MPGTKVAFDPLRSVSSQYAHVSPVILVTTVNADGSLNVAPKTQNTPVGKEGRIFMFVCTPIHHTYQNIKRTGEFVVNYPTPELIEKVAAAASVFEDRADEIVGSGLTATSSVKVRPPRIKECQIHLECELVEIREYGPYGLVVGKVVAASGNEEVVLAADTNTVEFSRRLAQNPLLAYVYPNHFTAVNECRRFVFPQKYKP